MGPRLSPRITPRRFPRSCRPGGGPQRLIAPALLGSIAAESFFNTRHCLRSRSSPRSVPPRQSRPRIPFPVLFSSSSGIHTAHWGLAVPGMWHM